MIKIDNTIKPPSFTSESHLNIKKDLKKYYKDENVANKQGYFKSGLALILNADAKEALKKVFRSKCGYCESVTNGDIDNFRPKNGARNLDGKVSSKHYWWLSFEWENFIYCCPTCNSFKGNWFPVVGNRMKIESTDTLLEKNLLIDPTTEHTEEHFSYADSGEIIGITERGKITIEILKLNRQELVSQRRNVYKEESNRFNLTNLGSNRVEKIDFVDYLAYYRSLINSQSDLPFIGIRLFFIRTNINTKPKLASKINAEIPGFLNIKTTTKKQSHFKFKKHPNLKSSVISKIEIENFKSIENLTIDINNPQFKNGQSPWLMLLGENSVGKTSILQAIAIGLAGQNYLNKISDIYDFNRFININAQKSVIKIWFFGEDSPNEVTISKNRVTSNETISPTYIIGYGSTRLFPDGTIKHEKVNGHVKIKNIFKPYVTLNNPNEWLISRSEGAFNKAAKRIKIGLALNDEDRLIRRGKEIILLRNNLEASLDSLSDGYKSSITLIVDIMSTMSAESSDYSDINGIVLLDEIETHLHPKWKMKIVKSIREAFPKLTVFATTHDPLCLKGLYENEVIVLSKNKNNKLKLIKNLPSTDELRADQLLTSEFFGLNSTLDEATENNIERFYFLLSRANLTLDETNELDVLKILMDKKITIGDSLRDIILYKSIDKMIAENKFSNVEISDSILNEKTFNRIDKLLKSF
ncbi:MAG: hypothetical protein K0S53_811 [Bacteroidetes bacterium]|jgi:uncharacterized protein (TIGR02646 family)|nr:hypothetical protein [Bacteroidota bacterium]